MNDNATNPASEKARCPGCDTAQRLSYDAMTDDMTCWKCGLVSTVNEVRAHYKELKARPKNKTLGEIKRASAPK